MSAVFFNNGINIASGGADVLNALLTDIINEIDLQDEYGQYKQEMMFHDTRALSLEQKFSSMAGSLEIDMINENGVKPEGQRQKMPDKGFQIVEYGEKFTTSYLMKQWIEKSDTLTNADSSVQQEWIGLMDNARYLLEGAMMRASIEMIRTWTEGFSISAVFGPGSPTPKGQPLFSTVHPVRNGALTFRNTLATGTNDPLAVASLQDALNTIKKEVKLENGYSVRPPKGAYKLYVGKNLAVTARQILNTPGSQAGIYSGLLNNANQANVFSFDGNLVEICELSMLGDIDKNGDTIGLDTMRFLVNPDYIMKSRGFRYVDLYNPMLKNYTNDETDAYIVDIRAGFATDHYGAEAGIIGSKGDSTPY